MKKFLTLPLAALTVAGMSLSASAFAPVGNVSVPYATPKVDGVISADEYPAEGRVVFYSWGLQENGAVDVMCQESANNGLIAGAGKGAKTDKGWCFEVALNLEMLAEDVSLKANIDAIVEAGMPIGGLVNAYATSATETVGWDPAAHGLIFVFAEEVVETEAEVVDEVVEAPAAPQTFDTGIIAAVAVAVAAAGYAVSKKR